MSIVLELGGVPGAPGDEFPRDGRDDRAHATELGVFVPGTPVPVGAGCGSSVTGRGTVRRTQLDSSPRG